ncbi:cysteine hydrolase [Sulfuricurvum sp.]|uniref:cysteine hydrolase n=1 Tax=Sulfuricurvum sp. TaxID=2025608 RepID=UPI003567F4D8
MMVIDAKKSALILIEYQNEWLGKNAKLNALMEDKIQFEDSKRNSKLVLEYARKHDIHIVHIPLIVNNDYREFGKDKAKLGLRAVIQKVKTWQDESRNFYKDFEPEKDEFIIGGRVGASGFAGSNLDAILRNNKIENLFLIGYATHVCVESTLREAHDKGYNTYIISDATSAFTKEQKEFVEKNIVHHFGALLSTNEFLMAKNL